MNNRVYRNRLRCVSSSIIRTVVLTFVLFCGQSRLFAEVDLFNNIGATVAGGISIGNSGSYWYYAQRFSTTDSAIVTQVQVVLKRSTKITSGYYEVDLFSDSQNGPISYYPIHYAKVSSLDTVYKTITISDINLARTTNENFWIAIQCNSRVDWAYTNTTYPKATSSAYITTDVWNVYNTPATPQIMRVVAKGNANITVPSSQSSNINFSKITNSTANISWTEGNGTKHIVFIKEASTGTASIANNTTYGDNNQYGAGSLSTNDWYCIYNGSNTAVTVNGLSRATTYRVMVMDYNGTSGKEKYNVSTSTSNPANFTTSSECITVPGNTGSIVGSETVCAGTYGATYTSDIIESATSYKWLASNSAQGWTIKGSGRSATIDFGTSATSGYLTVTGVNECGESSIPASYYITVKPLPDSTKAISGKSSVLPGEQNVSYSIASVANATDYVWTYSGTGASITYTKNSATISFSTTATSGILRAYAHNDCGDGTASPDFAIKVQTYPDDAGSISGTSSPCAGSSADYTVPVIDGADEYIWEYSGTGQIISGNSNAVIISFSSSATSGYLTVKGKNKAGYGKVSGNFTINIKNVPGNAGAISGSASICTPYTSQYSIAPVSNAISYIWAYTGSGDSIVETQNIASVKYKREATSGSLMVFARNTCGDGASSTLAVTVNPYPGDASTITGSENVCAGSSSNPFSVNEIPYASSYIWSYSGSGASIAGSGASITISFAKLATSGKLSIKGRNACGDGLSYEKEITIDPLPSALAALISTTEKVCSGALGIVCNSPQIENATNYIWNYTGTGVTINGTSKDITLNFGANATSGDLYVTGENKCGTGGGNLIKSYEVNRYPGAASVITGLATVCAGTTGNIYSVTDIPDATSYVWTYDGDGYALNGSGKSISIDFGSGASDGTLKIKGLSSCGYGTESSLAIKIASLPSGNGAISGSSSVCANTKGLIYTIGALSNTVTYEWTYSGTGTNFVSNNQSAVFEFGTSATDGNIMVVGKNACGQGNYIVLPIKVNTIPNDAGAIRGTANVCEIPANASYVIDDISLATSYVWKYTGTGVSLLQNSKNLSISFADNATPGVLSVYGQNECGVGKVSDGFPIVLSPVNAKPVISGNPSSVNKVGFCQGDTIVCKNYDSKLKYSWFKDDVLLSNQSNSYIQLETDASGNYSIQASYGECSKTSDTYVVVAYNVDTPKIVVKSDKLITLLIVDNSKYHNSSYLWERTDAVDVNSDYDKTNQYLMFSDTTHNGYYRVTVTDKGGCKAQSGVVQVRNQRNSISVYPTASSGQFTLLIQNNESGTVTARLVNTSGNVVKVMNFNKKTNQATYQIDATNLQSGNYLLDIQVNGTKETTKVVIQK